MNRIEFMEALSGLLGDIPEEDRMDALNYYNDYFDDAGVENEQRVIEELESPEKVAMKIKADREDMEEKDIKEKETEAKAGTSSDSRNENAYQYYQKDTYDNKKDNTIYQDNGADSDQGNKPWTSKWLKVILIIAIILAASPVIIPVAIGILAVAAGIVIAAFCLFLAIVICFAALAVAGIALAVTGIWNMTSGIGVGLAVLGVGLMAMAVGAVGTVIGVRLCIIVFPGIIRGIVWILRKPFHRREAA